MKYTISYAAMAVAFATGCGAAVAQEAAPAPAAEVIVVTASRIQLEPREVGSALSVVTAADLTAGQVSLVKDALQDIPGVQIGSRRPGALASVSIRGSTPGQVLFLIDGIELGDPSAISSAYQSDHLTSLDVDRVEVLRGNQSSLYGSDAIGGVVNIITQRATEDGVRMNAEAEAGSDETVSGGASLLGRHGALDYRLSATGFYSGGPSAADPELGATEDDAYRRWSTSGRVGYEPVDGLELQATGYYSDSDADLDNTTSDSSDRVEMDEYGVGLKAAHETADGVWRNALTLSRYNTERLYFGQWYRPQGDLYDGTKDAALYVLNFEPSDVIGLAAGFNIEEEKAVLENGWSAPFEESMQTRSAFAELALKPVAPLTVTLAARVDDNSRFGAFDTYRATAAYLIEGALGGDLKLRASYGTGAKAPSLYQLFDPSYGNRDLKEETSQGFDAGVDVLWDVAQLQFTVFDTEISDEIGFISRYEQFGETRSRGAEFAANVEVAPWVFLSQTLTVLDVQDGEADTWRGRPRYSGKTALTFAPSDRFDFTARARYRSESNPSIYAPAVDGSLTLDLLASYDLTDSVELYGRILNLADEDYQLTYGGNAPDRSVFAGLRYRM